MSATPKIVAIIPARYQSNRFEGKPLALIQGKPMIQHVVERAQRVPLLSRVVVATDDERIASVVEGFGGNWVMTRREHADYFAGLSYSLGQREQEGLRLFWEKLAQAGEIAKAPGMDFLECQ